MIGRILGLMIMKRYVKKMIILLLIFLLLCTGCGCHTGNDEPLWSDDPYLTITPYPVSILVGEVHEIEVKYYKCTLLSQTWSSDNTGVVIVDENGRLFGLSPGKATITASAEASGGLNTFCKIEVTVVFPEVDLPDFSENSDFIQNSSQIQSGSAPGFSAEPQSGRSSGIPVSPSGYPVISPETLIISRDGSGTFKASIPGGYWSLSDKKFAVISDGNVTGNAVSMDIGTAFQITTVTYTVNGKSATALLGVWGVMMTYNGESGVVSYHKNVSEMAREGKWSVRQIGDDANQATVNENGKVTINEKARPGAKFILQFEMTRIHIVLAKVIVVPESVETTAAQTAGQTKDLS